MNPEQKHFLSLAVAPARLNPEQAAWFLGFQEHDIPILVARGLLKPLGNPPANGVKYFAIAELEELKADRRWLARASDAVHHHWHQKNARRSKGPSRPLESLVTRPTSAVATTAGNQIKTGNSVQAIPTTPNHDPSW